MVDILTQLEHEKCVEMMLEFESSFLGVPPKRKALYQYEDPHIQKYWLAFQFGYIAALNRILPHRKY